MPQTPERAADALTALLPTSFSPTPFSDDDTISDNSFDAGSDHFAFTPKRPGKLHRAWERKPATPFAPRTETQKIWKRVPLQDKPSNAAIGTQTSTENDANARGIKRVRLTAPVAGNGKENYANTQWDKPSDDARRKVPKELKNAIQSTRNSLSPLRKDSTFEILNDPQGPTALQLEADHVIRRLEEMQKDEDNIHAISTDGNSPAVKAPQTELPEHTQTSTLDKGKAEADCEHEEATSEDGEATTPSTNGFFTDSIIFDDQDSESEIDEDPIAEEVLPDEQNSDSGSDISPDQLQSIFMAPEDAYTSSHQADRAPGMFPEGPETSLGSFELQTLQTEAREMEEQAENMVSEEAAYNLTTGSNEDATSQLLELEKSPDHLETATRAQGQLGAQVESQHRPAEDKDGKAEFITSDGNNGEESPSQVSEEEAATETARNDEVIFSPASDKLSNQLFTPQAPILLAPDAPPSDDAAYLHDFLTRARARKAARAASSPEKVDYVASSPAKNTRQALANLGTAPVSPSMPAQTELEPEDMAEDTMNDDQVTSPCRRSSRPRFPKPLKAIVPAIPNTIPVRRSNGTEFIFLPRSEAMQNSLDTRTNTQRNKGEAVRPSVRLESLGTREFSPIKERKKSSKGKKMVKWDEKLSQEQLETVLDDQAVVLEVKPEGAMQPQATAEEKAGSEAEKSEKREKNARKSVKRLGTVNGTPAPKRSLPVPTRTLRARTKG